MGLAEAVDSDSFAADVDLIWCWFAIYDHFGIAPVTSGVHAALRL
jgi:hypothetical protein